MLLLQCLARTSLPKISRAFISKHPEKWDKRVRHFYDQKLRVKKGAVVWCAGDIETFGKCVLESGRSSIRLYETGSEELRSIQELMEKTDGIYGGRFSGAGFNGSSMVLVDPAKKESIEAAITEEYLARFPELEGKFSIYFCKTADGVEL